MAYNIPPAVISTQYTPPNSNFPQALNFGASPQGSTSINPEYRTVNPTSSGQTFGQKLKALAGSVLGGSSGTGLLGGLISGGFNLLGDKLAYNRQKEMYGIQRADALSDYERQRSDYLSDLADERAYNSPEAQVARLKAAGINPNTTFGSGSAVNTVSTATNNAGVNPASVPNVTSSPLGSAMISGASGLIQSSLAETQAEEMTSRIDLAKAQMVEMLSRIRNVDENTKARAIENGYLDALLSSTVSSRRQAIAESIDRMKSNFVQRFNSVVQANIASRRLNIDEKESAARIEKMRAEIDKYFAEVQRINQEYEFIESVKGYRQDKEKESWLEKQYDNAEKRFRSAVFTDWLDGLTYEEFGSLDRTLLLNYMRKW